MTLIPKAGEVTVAPGERTHVTVSLNEMGKVPLATIVLRQAEERTKLVVECATLVKRMEQLDTEIAHNDEWQRYPNNEYRRRVQQRFEEARRREAVEAQKMALRGTGTLSNRVPLQATNAPDVAIQVTQSPLGTATVTVSTASNEEDDGEHKLAVGHLQRALRAADFEADVWRQRALDVATASERERQQAKQLMEFELSTALKEHEQERSKLSDNLREREVALEKLQADHNVLQAVHDVQRGAAQDAQKRAETLQAQNEQFVESIRARNAELSDARGSLELSRAALLDTRRAADELQAEKKKIEEDVMAREAQVAALVRERSLQGAELDTNKKEQASLRAQLQASQEAEAARGVELAAARKEQQEASVNVDMLRSSCNRLQEDLTKHQKELEGSEEKVRILAESAVAKDAELSSTRRELSKALTEGEAHRAHLAEALSARDTELSTVRAELNRAISEGDAHRTLATRLQREITGLQREQDTLKRNLDEVQAEVEAGRTNLERLEQELQGAEVERDRKMEAANTERRRAELLNAKVENLEAALTNATAKQADAAFDRDAQKERADRLEETTGRLRKLLDGDGSLGSTMASTTGGGSECPPTPRRGGPLPPVRPPSAPRAPPSANGARPGPASPKERHVSLSVTMN